jgi:late competence protein required for DNA uptake (superfamily II DNA/RNA helicase)
MNACVLKQALMKLDSFIQDICELKDDSPDDRERLELIAEQASIMEVHLLNMYKKEVGDDDTLNDIIMDEIDEFPFSDGEDNEAINIFKTIVY